MSDERPASCLVGVVTVGGVDLVPGREMTLGWEAGRWCIGYDHWYMNRDEDWDCDFSPLRGSPEWTAMGHEGHARARACLARVVAGQSLTDALAQEESELGVSVSGTAA